MALTGNLGGSQTMAGRVGGSASIRIQIGSSRGLTAQVSPRQQIAGQVGGSLGLVGIIARPALPSGTCVVGSFFPVYQRCVFGEKASMLAGGFQHRYATAVFGVAAEAIIGTMAIENTESEVITG